jgi:trk system potassium uptake protein TrkH
MRIRSLLFPLGILGIALGISMLAPLLVALNYKEADARAFLISSLLIFFFGAFLLLLCRAPKGEITHREGFAMVTLGWIAAAFMGALPYYIHGATGPFVNAFFESASGFTTTGATIVGSIEDLPRGVLLWRSMTQWFGGMGIILLSLAIFPLLGVGGMQLYKAEVPGPVPDKIKPRVTETAKALWKVYILITVTEIVLLVLGRMEPFHAISHSFSTLATGGFSTRAQSIQAFNSVYFDVIIILFMLAAGINFSLHYRALKGDPGSYWRSSEWRFFLLIFVCGTLLIAADLRLFILGDILAAIRYAAFQTASILTTTGFTTANYEHWPTFSASILFLLMFVGGSAGSTGGSMKCLRFLVLSKSAYGELYRLVHPHAVIPLKMDGRVVPQEIVAGIWGFSILYLFLFVFASLLMALMGLDMISAFASVAACIGNIGPGLGSVGPADNYDHIPTIGKWLLSLCMILGRLEIYTVMVLFIPEFWRK